MTAGSGTANYKQPIEFRGPYENPFISRNVDSNLLAAGGVGWLIMGALTIKDGQIAEGISITSGGLFLTLTGLLIRHTTLPDSTVLDYRGKA